MSDTNDSTASAPTDEEVAAANQILARAAAVKAAALAEELRPIRDLAASDTFKATLADASALRKTFDEGSPFYAHLNAMIVGMTNLENDAATLAVPPEAVEPQPAT